MSFKRIFAATMLVFSAVSIAFTPTAQQIEQFKKLPKSQQQALAKQYGFDLSSLPMGNSNSKAANSSKPSVSQRQVSGEVQEGNVDPMAPKEKRLEAFGYDLFAGEPSSFAPSEMRSVPNDYVISSGDVIAVSFYGKDTATHEVSVDMEGRLHIPGFSPIQVVGLTYAELKAIIGEKVKNEAIGADVYVSIAELRSIQVLVVGEAYRPGSYTLSPLSNVTHALFASGGLTKLASLRNIEVKRQGETVSKIDLYDLLLQGDARSDVTLQSGDVIFIPTVGPQVSVEGLVKRSAIFELKEGDTAESLTRMFGGFKEDAFLQRVQVTRVRDNAVKSVISVDFRGEQVDYTPKGGDAIKVQAINSDIVDSISLIGAVTRPGNYQWYEGATLDSYITDVKSDLLPQSDLSYSIIVREAEELGEVKILQFSLREALNTRSILLHKNDEVYIFSRFNSQEKEDEVLRDLAMTAEEQELQRKVKLWHLYERRQFEKKVSFDLAMDQVSGSKKKKDKKNKKDYTPSVFGREALLSPIMAQLKFESSTGVEKQTVEIVGQVRFPGNYPISEGMDIDNVIQAAGGLLSSAYMEFAEITRITDSGEIQHFKSSLHTDNKEKPFVIEERDTVNILMKPSWQDDYKVHLRGEVVFPGEYIVKRGEGLSSLLQRAGGLTQFADPKAAIFTRESIKEQERKQLARLSDELRKDIAARSFQKSIGTNTSLSYDETNKLLRDLASVQAIGRLVIDLPSIMERTDSLVLQDGDTLYVPGKRDSISIIGEVNYSSSHLFRAGTSIEQYIDLSGGMRDRADVDKIYVIKASGAVSIPNRGSWFAVNNDVQLEAGDTIVVPLDASHMDNLTLWSTATQIFYQLGVGVAAVANIK
ncbi:SLBB domain-containing protein [Pseudoalteromonas sp. DL2-H2.2]|uniref:polysaccharide biosynthesis/export family protein n=1 Tax=Pseudoalteromonas sp. DL2-H2.2 TaxID=2908889 RepID=UPI001F1E33D8|nr:SLBB domain-containing protein [Pseudoalteromonas sp. DL2-H2.2]MCF2908819.1 SLBB domain-containing protein [Pseudoalteromonas sp. DL2-H2.2]